METKEISSNEDLLDVRDIIARYEELSQLVSDEEISEENGAETQKDDNGNTKEDVATCGECNKSWNDALITGRTPAPGGRCPYEGIHEEIEELAAITELLDDLKGNGGDEQWRGDWYPITLIADSYFEDFARQEAEDIGLIKDDASWPYTCIDWARAADELKTDYTTVDFGGNTFWYR